MFVLFKAYGIGVFGVENVFMSFVFGIENESQGFSGKISGTVIVYIGNQVFMPLDFFKIATIDKEIKDCIELADRDFLFL